jgi:hypothetical protein
MNITHKNLTGIILSLVLGGLLLLPACSRQNLAEPGPGIAATPTASYCPIITQSAPLPGSEIGPARDPEGIPLYPGSVRIGYNEPPE